MIKLQFGDNSIQRFQVIDKRDLPVSKTAQYLFAKRTDIERQLNLVTCGGTFNKKSDKYDNRLVIVTKRIDNKLP
jgi:hypothetical protein